MRPSYAFCCQLFPSHATLITCFRRRVAGAHAQAQTGISGELIDGWLWSPQTRWPACFIDKCTPPSPCANVHESPATAVAAAPAQSEVNHFVLARWRDFKNSDMGAHCAPRTVNNCHGRDCVFTICHTHLPTTHTSVCTIATPARAKRPHPCTTLGRVLHLHTTTHVTPRQAHDLDATAPQRGQPGHTHGAGVHYRGLCSAAPGYSDNTVMAVQRVVCTLWVF